MRGGSIFNFCQTRPEKRFRAFEVFAGVMMKRRGDLNDALKAAAFDAARLQPDFLPRLMRFKETA